MTYEIGINIMRQKDQFVGLKSAKNFGHLVDLCYVPIDEKLIVRENILKGARDQGSAEGIVFLNEK